MKLALLFLFTLSTAQAVEEFGRTPLPARGIESAAPAPAMLAVSDTQIGVWFGCAVALATGAAAILAFLRKEARMQEPKPERNVTGGPLSIRKEKDCVDRDEHLALMKRVADIELELRDSERRQLARMDEHFSRLTHERSVSIARLHERIEEAQAQTRDEIDTKTDSVRREVHAMPAQIVQLLRDTGAIGAPPGGRPR